MNLKEQIMADMKVAMKEGDQAKLTVLRGLQAVFSNKLIEKRSSGEDSLSDMEMLAIVMSEAKKRRDSIDAFTQGGRADLAEKETQELKLLEIYLPQQLSREEVEQKVTAILSANPEVTDIGSAMKLVMESLRGQADGKVISEIVKQKFNA